jgi:hypothetical protein
MRHLRVRQLSAFADIGLVLTRTSTNETVGLEGTDLHGVVAAVRAAAGTQLAAVLTQKVLLPLIDVGVEYITDVLSRDYTKVISAQDLRRKYGRRVRTKHIQALYKLAYLLHDPAPTKVCTDKAQLCQEVVEAKGIRTVADAHMQTLHAPSALPLGARQEQANPTNVAAPGTRTDRASTIPGMVPKWQGTAAAGASTDGKLVVDCTNRRSGTAQPARRNPAAAGHRRTIGADGEEARQQVVVPPGRTYLARSEQAAQFDEPAKQMELLPTVHHLVKDIEAERQCTAHTDRASRAHGGHHQGHTQQQVLVHWETTIEEDWSLAAHERLGYEPVECFPIAFDGGCTGGPGPVRQTGVRTVRQPRGDARHGGPAAVRHLQPHVPHQLYGNAARGGAGRRLALRMLHTRRRGREAAVPGAVAAPLGAQAEDTTTPDPSL